LPELIHKGIAAAVDAVEVMITFGTFDEVAISFGSGGEGTLGSGDSIVLAVHIVGGGGFLPDGGEAFIVDGTYLVDATIGTVRLYATGVVV
jgi:hypothetical protein